MSQKSCLRILTLESCHCAELKLKRTNSQLLNLRASDRDDATDIGSSVGLEADWKGPLTPGHQESRTIGVSGALQTVVSVPSGQQQDVSAG